MPSAMAPAAWLTISSRKRLAWRALRAISEMPLLWLSSSSSVMIGRNTSCSSKRNRLVGSCIRTLVSRTNSLVAECCGFGRRDGTDFPEAAGSESSGRSVGFNKVEHLLCVAWNLDSAPLAPDDAVAVDDEGAALDAAHLPAVHVLHLHDAELRAHLLALVGEQVEGKLHLGFEVLVRLQGVARHAEYRGSGLHEPGVEVPELRSFDRAARGVVPGIEVENHQSGFRRREPEVVSAGGGKCEVAYCFVGHSRSESSSSAIVARIRRTSATSMISTIYEKNVTSSEISSAGASSGR